MANSAITIKINSWPAGKAMEQTTEAYYGTFVVGAGNYVANGIPLVWTGMVDVNSGNTILPLSTATKPFYVSISGLAGYLYVYDQAHNSLRVFGTGASSGAAFGELTGGSATPAGVTGDTISFRAVFTKD